ncbi:hypothetical protein SLS55_000761 [Diplodia seriata]|uniref:Uncharacterized protein n=1 Tax=Diplodia seriata TaxID=420778 RepID=A0ABR3CY59_9PEZI
MSDPPPPPDTAEASKFPKEWDTDEGFLDWLQKQSTEADARQRQPGPKLFTAMRVTERTLEHLKGRGQEVYGLKMYRLTYEDDTDWQKFREMLDTKTHHNLTRKKALPEGETLLSMIDWAVEDDKEQWDNASLEEVRKHYRDEIETSLPHQRCMACIVVDAESLQSIMDGKKYAPFTGLHQDSPFVKVLEADLFRVEPFRSAHVIRPEQTGAERVADDDKIRWMKVNPSTLLPDFYDRLQFGFDNVYRTGPRPPYVWDG